MPAPGNTGRRRKHQLLVTLDTREKRQLDRLARTTGLTKSDIVRQAIRKQHKQLVIVAQ